MIGQQDYRGHLASQCFNFKEILGPFLLKENFTDIIEIGTALGGLTLFLHDILPNTKIITYDVTDQGYQFLRDVGVEVRINNAFSLDYNYITDKKLKTSIQEANKLLILCDGGYKIGEFKAITPHLRQGDFIMAHDYCQTKSHFEQNFKGKIWDWCEITEEDIIYASNTYRLDSVYQELKQIVWCCKRKS